MSADASNPQNPPLRSSDGRAYPSHLRAYHKYDTQLLPLLGQLQPASFDDLSAAVSDREIRAALPSWLSSARWRGLVEIDESVRGMARQYVLGRDGGASASGSAA
jgi:hypothetical protein